MSNFSKLIKLILLIVTFIPANSWAQNISGRVVDHEKKSLQYATITIINPKDSTLVSFTSANKQGDFSLTKIPYGKNIFQVHFVGFQTFQKEIDFNGKNLNMGTIALVEGNELDEVVVNSYVPILVKNDTVSYNIKAFKVRIDENVEDLLKKLPGVEVDADGTVTAQGEEVKKIYVNGKEFFSGDPKVATKNLSADAIKNVEVIDEKSDKARVTGVNDSERTKVINLELKDDRKVNDFGKFQAGYGTDERYLTSMNYNRFTPKVQASIIGRLNNVNSSGSDISEIMSFGGGRHRRMFSSQPTTTTGYLTTGIAGINLGYEIEKKKDLNLDYFYNHTNATSGDISTKRTEFIKDEEIYSENKSKNENIGNSHKSNFSFIDRSNKLSTLIIKGNIKKSYNSSLSENSLDRYNGNRELDLQSVGNSNNESESGSANISLDFVNRFNEKSKRNIDISSDFDVSKSINSNTNNQLYTFNISDAASTYNLKKEITKEENSQDLDFDISIRYTEPLAEKHFLEARISTDYGTENNDVNQSELEDDLQITPLIYDLFMNTSDIDGGLYYKYDNGKLTISAGASVSNQTQKFGVKVTDEYEETYLTMRPGLRIRYRPQRGRFMNLNISKSTDLPSLSSLSPVVNNYNPLFISQGNPNLTPSENYSVNGIFVRHKITSGFSIFSRASFSHTTNEIINTEFTDADGIRTTSYVNYGNSDNLSVSFNHRNTIKAISMRYNLSLSAGARNYATIINGDVNETNTKNGRLGLSLENDKKDKLDASIGATLSKDYTTFTAGRNADREYFQQSYYVKFDWNMTERLNFNSQFKYDIYTDSNFGTDQSIPVWNASLSYSFLKNKSLNMKLTALDILNKSIGLKRSSSDNYFQETQREVLGTYYMLSLTYNLNGNKNPNAKQGHRSGGRHRRM